MDWYAQYRREYEARELKKIFAKVDLQYAAMRTRIREAELHKHGGWRPGSGRKKASESHKMKVYSWRATAEEANDITMFLALSRADADKAKIAGEPRKIAEIIEFPRVVNK
jgi:hypothetical protein